MNQHTVSTISLEGFGAFATFASDLQKALDATPAVVALDAPKVYGARTAMKVEAKPAKTAAKPKATPTSGARNPDFGVEDVVRIRRSVARREIEKGMAEREARLFASKFVMKIVLGEHGENPNFEDLCKEIEVGVIELLGKNKADKWLNVTCTSVNRELDAEAAPKPVVAKATTPVVVRPAPKPAPVAPKASGVVLPPKHNAEGIKQLIGEAELDRIGEKAEKLVGCLKGDGRYTAGERNELMSLVRDMTVARAMVLGFSLRDAETTADAALEALPRPPMTMPKPAKVETLSVKTNATPVADAKPLTKEELAALVAPCAPVVEVSQETPKAKREHKLLTIEELGELVAKRQEGRAKHEAHAAAQKAKAALKACAQPPLPPKPPKAEKGNNSKKRGKKGQHAEARA